MKVRGPGHCDSGDAFLSPTKLLVVTKIITNKKAVQQDVYHPLANHTCFGGHQMSVLVGNTQVNKFEQVFSDGY